MKNAFKQIRLFYFILQKCIQIGKLFLRHLVHLVHCFANRVVAIEIVVLLGIYKIAHLLRVLRLKTS